MKLQFVLALCAIIAVNGGVVPNFRNDWEPEPIEQQPKSVDSPENGHNGLPRTDDSTPEVSVAIPTELSFIRTTQDRWNRKHESPQAVGVDKPSRAKRCLPREFVGAAMSNVRQEIHKKIMDVRCKQCRESVMCKVKNQCNCETFCNPALEGTQYTISEGQNMDTNDQAKMVLPPVQRNAVISQNFLQFNPVSRMQEVPSQLQQPNFVPDQRTAASFNNNNAPFVGQVFEEQPSEFDHFGQLFKFQNMGVLSEPTEAPEEASIKQRVAADNPEMRMIEEEKTHSEYITEFPMVLMQAPTNMQPTEFPGLKEGKQDLEAGVTELPQIMLQQRFKQPGDDEFDESFEDFDLARENKEKSLRTEEFTVKPLNKSDKDMKAEDQILGLAPQFMKNINNPITAPSPNSQPHGLSSDEDRFYSVGSFGSGPMKNLLSKLLHIPKKDKLDSLVVLAKVKSQVHQPEVNNPVIIDTAHIFSKNSGPPEEVVIDRYSVSNTNLDFALVEILNRQLDVAIEEKNKTNGDPHLTSEEIDKVINYVVELFDKQELLKNFTSNRRSTQSNDKNMPTSSHLRSYNKDENLQPTVQNHEEITKPVSTPIQVESRSPKEETVACSHEEDDYYRQTNVEKESQNRHEKMEKTDDNQSFMVGNRNVQTPIKHGETVACSHEEEDSYYRTADSEMAKNNPNNERKNPPEKIMEGRIESEKEQVQLNKALGIGNPISKTDETVAFSPEKDDYYREAAAEKDVPLENIKHSETPMIAHVNLEHQEPLVSRSLTSNNVENRERAAEGESTGPRIIDDTNKLNPETGEYEISDFEMGIINHIFGNTPEEQEQKRALIKKVKAEINAKHLGGSRSLTVEKAQSKPSRENEYITEDEITILDKIFHKNTTEDAIQRQKVIESVANKRMIKEKNMSDKDMDKTGIITEETFLKLLNATINQTVKKMRRGKEFAGFNYIDTLKKLWQKSWLNLTVEEQQDIIEKEPSDKELHAPKVAIDLLSYEGLKYLLAIMDDEDRNNAKIYLRNLKNTPIVSMTEKGGNSSNTDEEIISQSEFLLIINSTLQKHMKTFRESRQLNNFEYLDVLKHVWEKSWSDLTNTQKQNIVNYVPSDKALTEPQTTLSIFSYEGIIYLLARMSDKDRYSAQMYLKNNSPVVSSEQIEMEKNSKMTTDEFLQVLKESCKSKTTKLDEPVKTSSRSGRYLIGIWNKSWQTLNNTQKHMVLNYKPSQIVRSTANDREYALKNNRLTYHDMEFFLKKLSDNKRKTVQEFLKNNPFLGADAQENSNPAENPKNSIRLINDEDFGLLLETMLNPLKNRQFEKITSSKKLGDESQYNMPRFWAKLWNKSWNQLDDIHKIKLLEWDGHLLSEVEDSKEDYREDQDSTILSYVDMISILHHLNPATLSSVQKFLKGFKGQSYSLEFAKNADTLKKSLVNLLDKTLNPLYENETGIFLKDGTKIPQHINESREELKERWLFDVLKMSWEMLSKEEKENLINWHGLKKESAPSTNEEKVGSKMDPLISFDDMMSMIKDLPASRREQIQKYIASHKNGIMMDQEQNRRPEELHINVQPNMEQKIGQNTVETETKEFDFGGVHYDELSAGSTHAPGSSTEKSENNVPHEIQSKKSGIKNKDELSSSQLHLPFNQKVQLTSRMASPFKDNILKEEAPVVEITSNSSVKDANQELKSNEETVGCHEDKKNEKIFFEPFSDYGGYRLAEDSTKDLGESLQKVVDHISASIHKLTDRQKDFLKNWDPNRPLNKPLINEKAELNIPNEPSEVNSAETRGLMNFDDIVYSLNNMAPEEREKARSYIISRVSKNPDEVTLSDPKKLRSEHEENFKLVESVPSNEQVGENLKKLESFESRTEVISSQSMDTRREIQNVKPSEIVAVAEKDSKVPTLFPSEHKTIKLNENYPGSPEFKSEDIVSKIIPKEMITNEGDVQNPLFSKDFAGIENMATNVQQMMETTTVPKEHIVSQSLFDHLVKTAVQGAHPPLSKDKEPKLGAKMDWTLDAETASTPKYLENSKSLLHLGKLIAQGSQPKESQVNQALQNTDMFFVGNGIKLPLTFRRKPDGGIYLSVDIEKLCDCKTGYCNTQLSRSALEEVNTVNKELQQIDKTSLIKLSQHNIEDPPEAPKVVSKRSVKNDIERIKTDSGEVVSTITEKKNDKTSDEEKDITYKFISDDGQKQLMIEEDIIKFHNDNTANKIVDHDQSMKNSAYVKQKIGLFKNLLNWWKTVTLDEMNL